MRAKRERACVRKHASHYYWESTIGKRTAPLTRARASAGYPPAARSAGYPPCARVGLRRGGRRVAALAVLVELAGGRYGEGGEDTGHDIGHAVTLLGRARARNDGLGGGRWARSAEAQPGDIHEPIGPGQTRRRGPVGSLTKALAGVRRVRRARGVKRVCEAGVGV